MGMGDTEKESPPLRCKEDAGVEKDAIHPLYSRRLVVRDGAGVQPEPANLFARPAPQPHRYCAILPIRPRRSVPGPGPAPSLHNALDFGAIQSSVPDRAECGPRSEE